MSYRCFHCNTLVFGSSHLCTRPEPIQSARAAEFHMSYPWQMNGRQTVSVTALTHNGREHSSLGGYCTKESEIRKHFEHFILDLKLLGMLKDDS